MQAAVVLATGQLWLFLLQFPLGNLAMCVLFARTAGGPDPLVARLAAEVVALRQATVPHPGLHRFFQRATGREFLRRTGFTMTRPAGGAGS